MTRAAKPAEPPVLVWFTRDLRLHDQPALHAAAACGRPMVACFVLDEAAGGRWAIGGAQRWWLHHSLTALTADLAALGATLVLRRGDAVEQIGRLVGEMGAVALHVGQPVEPAERATLDALAASLPGCAIHRHWTTLLFDPERLRTTTGGPYGVYTPFANACLARGIEGEALPAPERLRAAPAPASDRLEDWGLLPEKPDWAGGFRETWDVGEAAARRRLSEFAGACVAGYAEARNLPGVTGTSSLSPHLHWGEISAGEVWRAAARTPGAGSQSYVREVLWREFCAHLLWHHPSLPDAPLKPRFAAMKWRVDPAGLRAWQRGRTGIPIVDAGQRQLWHIGWQHNRVRLITASFLVKHLLIDWREGEAWFWDTLVDANLASNAANWQWVAGSGADAAPFFRIFNPVLQGQKFDAAGGLCAAMGARTRPARCSAHPRAVAGAPKRAAGCRRCAGARLPGADRRSGAGSHPGAGGVPAAARVTAPSGAGNVTGLEVARWMAAERRMRRIGCPARDCGW